jgi:hypothetical protein
LGSAWNVPEVVHEEESVNERLHRGAVKDFQADVGIGGHAVSGSPLLNDYIARLDQKAAQSTEIKPEQDEHRERASIAETPAEMPSDAQKPLVETWTADTSVGDEGDKRQERLSTFYRRREGPGIDWDPDTSTFL